MGSAMICAGRASWTQQIPTRLQCWVDREMIGEFSGLGSAAIWAAISTVMRYHSKYLSPIMLNGLRCVFAALTLAFLVVLFGQMGSLTTLPTGAVAAIVVSGILGQALGDGLFISSLKLIGSSRALPVSNIHPLLTVILAVVILGEPVSWATVGGGLLVLGGVYLVAFPYSPLRQIGHLLDTPDKRGLLLAVGAAGCWSLSTIILRPALANLPLLPANLIRMSTAAALLIALELAVDRRHIPGKLPHRSLSIMALAGVMNAFSSLLYLGALQYAGAAKTAVLVATSPLFGLPLAMLFLRERVGWRIVAGTFIAVTGITLVFSG